MKTLEDKLETIKQAADNATITPNATRGRKATLARQKAIHAASKKKAISLRLDVHTLERLKVHADGGSYQSLINHLLTQWCDAMDTEAQWLDRLDDLQEQIDTLKRTIEKIEEAKDVA